MSTTIPTASALRERIVTTYLEWPEQGSSPSSALADVIGDVAVAIDFDDLRPSEREAVDRSIDPFVKRATERCEQVILEELGNAASAALAAVTGEDDA